MRESTFANRICEHFLCDRKYDISRRGAAAERTHIRQSHIRQSHIRQSVNTFERSTEVQNIVAGSRVSSCLWIKTAFRGHDRTLRPRSDFPGIHLTDPIFVSAQTLPRRDKSRTANTPESARRCAATSLAVESLFIRSVWASRRGSIVGASGENIAAIAATFGKCVCGCSDDGIALPSGEETT